MGLETDRGGIHTILIFLWVEPLAMDRAMDIPARTTSFPRILYLLVYLFLALRCEGREGLI